MLTREAGVSLLGRLRPKLAPPAPRLVGADIPKLSCARALRNQAIFQNEKCLCIAEAVTETFDSSFNRGLLMRLERADT